jgi:hypothetical protein
MPALGAGITSWPRVKDVDGRDKPGHDVHHLKVLYRWAECLGGRAGFFSFFSFLSPISSNPT